MPKRNSIQDEIGNLGGTEDNTGADLLMEASEAEAAVEASSADDSHGVTGMLGTKILTPAQRLKAMSSGRTFSAEREHLSKVGEKITANAEIRNGWIPVDRELLGDRNVFYPETWEFMVRPATVEAIKNWSTIDENDPSSLNQVFNEILKSCLAIRDTTTDSMIPWGNLNSWDRFWFVLLIRDYTFVKGEAKLELEEDCASCDNPVTFTLNSSALYYETPDPEVMHAWNQEEQCWQIDTDEYGLDGVGLLQLYPPTVEKDANLFAYVQNTYQEKGRLSRDMEIFLKYLPWLLPKAPKDQTLLKRKVREKEMEFKGWTLDEFLFMENVINNIVITPSTKMKAACPTCGEEVTTDIRFPDGIRSLFAIQGRYTKFGKK